MKRVAGTRFAGVALAVVLALLPRGARAQDAAQPLLLDEPPVTVRLTPVPPAIAGLDRTTVGDPLWVAVNASGPVGYRLLPQTLIEALGEREELAVLGSERRDGVLYLQLALFRPGEVVLPEVMAGVETAAGDTVLARVTSDPISIASVLSSPADTLLADIKPLWLRWHAPWWLWATLAALVVAALLFWWWRRRRRPAGEEWHATPDIYQAVHDRLVALRDEPSSGAGRVVATAAIGDALRDYFTDGWNLRARERTTLELLTLMEDDPGGQRGRLGSVLAVADLAKFARVDPGSGAVPALANRGIAVLDRYEEARKEAERREAESMLENGVEPPVDEPESDREAAS